jgi:hypothetical protein
MQAAMDLFDTTAAATADFAAAPDAADLGEQATNLAMATMAYDVNARVLEAQDATLRAAIDMLV